MNTNNIYLTRLLNPQGIKQMLFSFILSCLAVVKLREMEKENWGRFRVSTGKANSSFINIKKEKVPMLHYVSKTRTSYILTLHQGRKEISVIQSKGTAQLIIYMILISHKNVSPSGMMKTKNWGMSTRGWYVKKVKTLKHNWSWKKKVQEHDKKNQSQKQLRT